MTPVAGASAQLKDGFHKVDMATLTLIVILAIIVLAIWRQDSEHK